MCGYSMSWRAISCRCAQPVIGESIASLQTTISHRCRLSTKASEPRELFLARLPAEQAVEPAAAWRLAKRPRREARAGDGCQPKLAGIGDHVAGGAGRDAHQWIWSRVLTTPTGKPYDKGRLTKAIQARLVEIGQPKSQYTLHGLRKAAAVLLAESG